jgi:hypothetical protein
MKKYLMSYALIMISVLCFAEILKPPFELKEFDVTILKYPYMNQLEKQDSDDFDIVYAFTDEKKNFEIRYAFFTQTQKDVKDIKTAYGAMIFPVIMNVAGYDVSSKQVSSFNDSDVSNEFNGNSGTTIFIPNPKSNYGKGFKYIMLNFYYKENQGIVAQSILFNDMEFTKTKEFMEIFHSFKFHE